VGEIFLFFQKDKMKETIKDIYWYFNSPKIKNPKLPTSINSVLFICMGNICRSPFAEHIANKIALERSWKKMVFCSAGLQVPASLGSPLEVLEVAEKFGVNLNAHKSNVITSRLAESSDMIIAMESWHVIRLREMFPMYGDKTFLLPLFESNTRRWKWSYERYNISDPYGKPLPYFQKCFHRIEICINELFSKFH
jgi:protein-tyrosine phosphatase